MSQYDVLKILRNNEGRFMSREEIEKILSEKHNITSTSVNINLKKLFRFYKEVQRTYYTKMINNKRRNITAYAYFGNINPNEILVTQKNVTEEIKNV